MLGESFSADALHELDKAIAYNKKLAASVMAPEELTQMYDDDAYSLEAIRDMVIQDKARGESFATEPLRNLISRLDTAVREQIPLEIYNWVAGEKL